MLTIRGHSSAEGNFDWKDAVADAAVIAGFTFFTTLGSMTLTGVVADPKTALLAAVISAGSQFFAMLLVKRGLVEKKA